MDRGGLRMVGVRSHARRGGAAAKAAGAAEDEGGLACLGDGNSAGRGSNWSNASSCSSCGCSAKVTGAVGKPAEAANMPTPAGGAARTPSPRPAAQTPLPCVPAPRHAPVEEPQGRGGAHGAEGGIGATSGVGAAAGRIHALPQSVPARTSATCKGLRAARQEGR
eukprot:CAMPEP_0179868286 /NCGR_PEP_ID=MMETSP0982-20121206/18746_1 /TAXON_ID=483367 /ORGANISM="non described non described, Strain CCMP 2436" /LENGTH=164 /DNA_ID=CAMNT_0021757949 /DNA_START=546 /DNA_END=1040 /DNA_ORIENTATION=+